jgi:hypothetical protein
MKPDSLGKEVPTPTPPEIEEQIRRRAFELFEARGKEEGHELEDWLRAEGEIAVHKSDATAA